MTDQKVKESQAKIAEYRPYHCPKCKDTKMFIARGDYNQTLCREC